MFFDDEPKNYEEIGAEALNEMIEAWGKELFRAEGDAREHISFHDDLSVPAASSKESGLRLAFVRAWQNVNDRLRTSRIARIAN